MRDEIVKRTLEASGYWDVWYLDCDTYHAKLGDERVRVVDGWCQLLVYKVFETISVKND